MMVLFYSVSFLFFLYKRALVAVHIFQQEEYDNKRFLKDVLRGLKLVDKRLSGAILCAAAILFLMHLMRYLPIIIALLFILFAFLQKNPTRKAKKVLVLTQRVKRILSVFFVFFISFMIFFITFFYRLNTLTLLFVSLLFIQIIPFVLVFSNFLLVPIERKIGAHYLKEARAKLALCQPKIIGITGSYGKTSVKHILFHVLSSVTPTLSTPGSINTLMGISRIIREQLKPEHQFFIVEMGAYGIGSIKRLCDLTPPDYGIITAIGHAHYERFKNIESVAQAKFELAQAVFKKPSGRVVINGLTVDPGFIKKYGSQRATQMVTLSDQKGGENTYIISQTRQTSEGIEFSISFQEQSYVVKMPLYGQHHIENAALSFALAYTLGLVPETIIAALRSTPQIQHRLEVLRPKEGPIIINDAYNANPIGFHSALDVLALLKRPGGRTILVTPGMVELGALHDQKHYEIGQYAVSIVDVALVVVPNRMKSFIEGFQAAASDDQHLYCFNNFAEAKAWLASNVKSEDVILYENDLPDLYEAKVKI